MTKGERIVQAAMTWLGTPHINMAKVKGKGVDCGMLLVASLEDSGLEPHGFLPVHPYSNEWHLHHSSEWFLSYVKQYCQLVPTEEMAAGDFLMYQFGRCISHGAIYIGSHTIIHAVINQGVILSDLDDSMLYNGRGESRLRYVYRYCGRRGKHGTVSKPYRDIEGK